MKKPLIALVFFISVLLLGTINAFTLQFTLPDKIAGNYWGEGENPSLGSDLGVPVEDLPFVEIEIPREFRDEINPNHAVRYRFVLYEIMPAFQITVGGSDYSEPRVAIAGRYWKGASFKRKNVKQGFNVLNCGSGIISLTQLESAYKGSGEPKPTSSSAVRCDQGDLAAGIVAFYIDSIEGGKLEKVIKEVPVSGTNQTVVGMFWKPKEDDRVLTVHFKLALRTDTGTGRGDTYTHWVSNEEELKDELERILRLDIANELVSTSERIASSAEASVTATLQSYYVVFSPKMEQQFSKLIVNGSRLGSTEAVYTRANEFFSLEDAETGRKIEFKPVSDFEGTVQLADGTTRNVVYVLELYGVQAPRDYFAKIIFETEAGERITLRQKWRINEDGSIDALSEAEQVSE